MLLVVTSAWFSGILYAGEIELRQLEKSLENSLVTAVYTLQYDQYGEVPTALGLYCGECRKLHYEDLSELLENGQKLEMTGFAVASDMVLLPDILIEDNAVKTLEIKFKDQTVGGKVVNIYTNEGMLLIKLDKPLKGVQPVTLTPVKKGEKLYCYSRILEYGQWMSRLKAFSPGRAQLWNSSRISREMPGCSLVVNADGKVVAILGNNNELLENDRWDLPYTQWKALPIEQFYAWKKALEKRLAETLYPVTVHFREQKLSKRQRLDRENFLREIYSFAYKLPDGRICMPLLLAPLQCSLLRKIVVHTPNGDVEALPVRTLKEFGCIELALSKKVNWQPLANAIEPMQRELGMQVWAVNIDTYKRSCKIRVTSNALGSMLRGFAGQQYGFVIKRDHNLPVNEDMLFSLDGKLLGVRLSVRAFRYNGVAGILDAFALEKMLADPRQNVAVKSMTNDYAAIGTLGIEYQNMTSELAKSLNLETATRNGREGLLVSYVYPDSTASRLGIKNGDVLLKLIIPGMGKPIRLDNEQFAMRQTQQFPWQQLDRIPEMYYDEIPEPWNEVNNPLNNFLTTIGIGNEIELIAVCSGKVERKKFVIQPSPIYFEIAPRYKSNAFGIEVSNMTYEVRRYFRMDKSTPGVIISSISAGSSASTAGLKPYEIITAVNDKPVHNAEEFRKAVEGAAELRLSVRRLATDRVVTVKPKIGPRR